MHIYHIYVHTHRDTQDIFKLPSYKETVIETEVFREWRGASEDNKLALDSPGRNSTSLRYAPHSQSRASQALILRIVTRTN